jgi:hypothetical protein
LFAPTSAIGYANQHIDLNIMCKGVDHYASMRFFNWSKRIHLSFNLAFGSFALSGTSDTGFGVRIGHLGTGGIDLTSICKAIGIKKVGTGPITVVYNLDNSTVVEVPTSFTPTSGIVSNYELISDGSGRLILKVDEQVIYDAMTAPTGSPSSVATVSSSLVFAVENKASVAMRASAVISFVKVSIIDKPTGIIL